MPRKFHTRDEVRRQKRVFIATPSYAGVSSPYVYSLMQSMGVLREADWSVDWFHLEGHCHVDDARNYLVREFLASDCTDLMFIDADMGWQEDDLAQLLSHDRDVVAGVYPKKRDGADYPAQLPEGENWSDENGLIEALRVPTGFLRISRRAIEALYRDEPRRFLGGNEPDDSMPQAIIFERTYKDGHRISGDYSGCDKLRNAGFKIFIDPELSFSHQGVNEWGGRYGDWLRNKAGLSNYHIRRAVDIMRNGGDVDISLFAEMVKEYGNETFSATPDLLYSLYLVGMNIQGPMLETGTGLSTLVLACVSEATGNSLISLEHDKGWLLETRKLLRDAGLSHEPTFAPLTDFDGVTWYGIDDLPEDFALVLCDGPPRKYGREGLFRLHGHRMNSAVVFVDDFDTEGYIEWLRHKSVAVLGRTRKFGVLNNGHA